MIARYQRMVGVGGQAEIDKAGAGDLDAVDQCRRWHRGNDARSQIPWIGAGALGQHHRDIGGEIAVGRITRALDLRGMIAHVAAEDAFGAQCLQGCVNQLLELRLHGLTGVGAGNWN